MRPNVMPRRSRRRRRTPPAAEIWRILRLTIREDRIARRRLAALEEKYREEARERERLAAEREAKYHEEAEERKRQAEERERLAAEREAQYQKEAEERERLAAEREAQYQEEAEERKRRAAAFDEELRKAAEERERAAKERERAAKEREKAQAAMERRLNKIAGDADNRWGRLMEALVEGNLIPLFRDAGVPVVELFGRLRSQIGGNWREYDLAAVGESDVMVVEVKTTLRVSDVQRFTERIADFRRWRPFEARDRVWGALAYLSADGEAVPAAEAAGFYLVRAVGGNARLANSSAFQPRSF
jgi:hypothetical protein